MWRCLAGVRLVVDETPMATVGLIELHPWSWNWCSVSLFIKQLPLLSSAMSEFLYPTVKEQKAMSTESNLKGRQKTKSTMRYGFPLQ